MTDYQSRLSAPRGFMKIHVEDEIWIYASWSTIAGASMYSLSQFDLARPTDGALLSQLCTESAGETLDEIDRILRDRLFDTYEEL